MTTVEVTVKLEDGREFIGRIYRITGSKLGRDLDHMTFVAHVELQDGGTHTMLAPMLAGIDQFDPKVQQHITGILETVGVEFWEQLVGNYVIALFEQEYGTVLGFASLDGSRVYLTADTFVGPPVS